MKHYIKALERILLLEDRTKAIEKKQAERFPMLVEKLSILEKKIKYLERAKTREYKESDSYAVNQMIDEGGMDYSGAFESDIKE